MRELLRNLSLVLLVGSTLGIPDAPQKPFSQGSAQRPNGIAEEVNPEIITQPPQEIKKQKGVFEQLIAPFEEEAKRRRRERLLIDPDFTRRIDWELGRERFNILLVGFGETHEPPLTERAFISSFTIVSVDLASSAIDLVSFTHDIRAPEIERYKKDQGIHDGNPIKMYRAYEDGGFSLMRKVLENASGLPMDFQIVFNDTSIKELVDSVSGGVEVEIPASFSVIPFYLEGKKYGEGYFEQGRERMDGLRVLQFIKTVPKTRDITYPKLLEHNFRKHLFLRGLFKELQEEITNPIFIWKMFQFLRNQTNEGRLNSDFDVRTLILNNLAQLAKGVGRIVISDGEKTFPEIRRTVYIVDSSHGDGGVQWVNSSSNPKVRQQIQQGRYPDLATAIPIGGDPEAENLASGYWGAVRELIKRRLQ